MEVIGVTGGAGSGKSKVLSYLEENYGACVRRLDDVAKELQKKGGECYNNIVEEFGEGIIAPDGELDRGKLADIVFSDAQKRKLLNSLVHPSVKKYIERDIEQKRREGAGFYVIESAILPEAGYTNLCTKTWYVCAGEDVRSERLKSTRGYSGERICRMMKAQPTDRAYREFCGAVIDNGGDFEDTIRQIGELL